MCGIAGAVSADRAEAEAAIDRAVGSLVHRGPDATRCQTFALVNGRHVVLGHTRLRVIDNSPASDQPLSNEDGTVWVTYNGELYNAAELRSELQQCGHRFATASDTEVLVHLYEEYGDDITRMLNRLRGMFAFGLVDTNTGTVVVARDRLGIKPLYWAQHGDRFAFASEVRAVAATGVAGTSLDPVAVSSYLEWGIVQGPNTIVAGIRELEPGHVLLWRDSTLRDHTWWDLTVSVEPELADDAVRMLRATLKDSVRRHLIADRPVGVFLSSGVDSSALAVLAAASSTSDLQALTVTFPELGSDEGPAARRLASEIGARHEMVAVRGDDVRSDLGSILSAMDQPTSDAVNTWLVAKAASETGIVVVLSGVGGDELFGGYPSFRLVPRVARARTLLGVLPRRLRRDLATAIAHRRPGDPFSRTLLADRGVAGAYGAVRALFGPAEFAHQPVPALQNKGSTHALDQVTRLELLQYLPNQLLRDADQMSMAHSLELRVPLLDDSVVSAALSIPPRARAAPGKQLLAAAAGLTRPAPKHPFALPLDLWLRGPLRPWVRDSLLDPRLPLGDVIPGSMRKRLWERFEAGRVHWSRPWSIAVLRCWTAGAGYQWEPSR